LTRELHIRPTDTPLLTGLLAAPSPQPFFFDLDADDEYVGGILQQTGSLRLVVVPIVSHGHFYGIVNPSVVERRERLAETPALLSYLAGMVAQVATALDNTRLLEKLAYQARDDSLTGLVGHRGSTRLWSTVSTSPTSR
jgi:GAF domain-containing protein